MSTLALDSSDSLTLLHIRILLGVLKHPNAQALPQTNEIRILEVGTRHEHVVKSPKRFLWVVNFENSDQEDCDSRLT